MLVAMPTELTQFHTGCGVPTVLHGRVTRHASRPFVRVSPTLCTFERNDNSYAFILSHNLKPLREVLVSDTDTYYFIGTAHLHQSFLMSFHHDAS